MLLPVVFTQGFLRQPILPWVVMVELPFLLLVDWRLAWAILTVVSPSSLSGK